MRKILFCLLASSALACGSTVQLKTAAGATNGAGVDVDVLITITTGSGFVAVELQNLQEDAFTIAQTISGLTFDLSSAFVMTAGVLPVDTDSGSLTGPLIDQSTFDPNVATSVDHSDSINHWDLNSTGSTKTVVLSAIDSGTLDLIIGNASGEPANVPTLAGTYSATSGKGSIGNCHACPYILEAATFKINIAGVTSSTTINTATAIVSFGTATGENVALQQVITAPEPNTALPILGASLFGLIVLLRNRRRRPTV